MNLDLCYSGDKLNSHSIVNLVIYIYPLPKKRYAKKGIDKWVGIYPGFHYKRLGERVNKYYRRKGVVELELSKENTALWI